MMNTRQALAAYAAAFLVMLVLDAIWLSTMASRLYKPVLGSWMRPEPDLAAAGLFYALYLLGVVVMAVRPAMQSASSLVAAGWGAFLGLLCYGTYDLTNQATLVGWPWYLTLIDLAWGCSLTAVAAAAAHRAARAVRSTPS
jgi:uncharacterized membrane protein